METSLSGISGLVGITCPRLETWMRRRFVNISGSRKKNPTRKHVLRSSLFKRQSVIGFWHPAFRRLQEKMPLIGAKSNHHLKVRPAKGATFSGWKSRPERRSPASGSNRPSAQRQRCVTKQVSQVTGSKGMLAPKGWKVSSADAFFNAEGDTQSTGKG